MDFVENVVESFTSGGGRREEVVEERTEYYSSGPGGAGGPPPVPRPWLARWAEQERTWFYVNEETGERSWEVPSSYGGGGSGGYGGQQRGYEYEQTTYVQEEQPRNDHKFAYGAAGVAAGVLGGAVLTYEGEKIHNDWDREKDRIEERVEDFPENAAQWTGEKVGEVEYGVDRVKNDVEDFPENAAEWVGDKVGSVERFGDEVDYAYDEGRAQGRDGW